MNVSNTEIQNIESHEGLSLTAYYDQKGYSIGYGHFTGVASQGDYSALYADLAQYGMSPDSFTAADADTLDRHDVQNAVNAVSNGLTRNVSQTAFDALVDFAYGSGVGAVTHPIADINLGDYQSAANYIANYVHDANGNVIPTLVPLRQATANAVLADANYNPQTAGFGWIAGGVLLLIAAPKIIDYLKEKGYV